MADAASGANTAPSWRPLHSTRDTTASIHAASQGARRGSVNVLWPNPRSYITAESLVFASYCGLNHSQQKLRPWCVRQMLHTSDSPPVARGCVERLWSSSTNYGKKKRKKKGNCDFKRAAYWVAFHTRPVLRSRVHAEWAESLISSLKATAKVVIVNFNWQQTTGCALTVILK